MANTNTKSIAGRAHGATPAAAAPQTKRYYPQLEGIEGIHPEVSRAIRTLYDNVYQIRDDKQEADKVAASAAKPGNRTASPSDPAYATGIHGIQVKAPTDPSSLKDGYTLRYSAAQGQFIFDV